MQILKPAALTALLLRLALPARGADGDPAAPEHFEKRVRPLLAENCWRCHGPAKQRGGLRLDHRATILKGGESGPAIVPGDPDRSRLIRAVRYRDIELQMPPPGKLRDEEIAALEAWVRMGAPWPGEEGPAGAGGPAAFDLEARRRAHWSWRPVLAREPPPVRNADWCRSPVDRFILVKLEEKGIDPAPPAERRALLRRLAYDLTGLPPSPAEVEAFAALDSPDALERAVDRLLDSPHFGERWARHWLDLVRYAETLGHEFDYPIHHAHKYRDYVIRALNADLPYDRFVIEHLAGDLLVPPRLHPERGTNESVLGTAFLWLGQEGHSPVDVRQQESDRVENQIDVLSKTFLGLTVACARCHDHKFDAISTRDYYALYGMLKSTRYSQAAIDAPQAVEEKVRRLRALGEEIRQAGADAGKAGAAPAGRDPAPETGPAPAPEGSAGPGEELFADFRGPGLDGWLPQGPAFLVPAEGWAHSGLISRRLQGALRSPSFTIERRFIHARAAGRQSRINVVIDGYNLIRDPIYGGLKKLLASDAPVWVTFDVGMWQGHRAYIELCDLETADPADDARKHGYAPDGWLAVERIAFSDGPPAEPRDAPALEAAGGAAPDSPEGLAAGGAGGRLAALRAKYRELEASIPAPDLAPAATDGPGEDELVFIRGSHKNLGERVPRRFLEAVDGPDPLPIARGSGRLELARRLVDPANPFPARVMVNRVWAQLFGAGLVATVDDFGAMGRPPTHPELLDWLARRFVEEGWSVKRLIRLLATSSAYRMASAPSSPAAEELDPTNALLHRMPVRRLSAEAVRDSVLAVSGRLDRTLFGPPVPVHLTSFMDGRGRPERSGPLDGAGRRSLYLEVRRNFLSPLLLAFDAPLPFTTVGKRTSSNVPAQALALLNDPFVAGQAALWARRLLALEGTSPPERIREMFLAAFGRSPAAEETASALAFLAEQGEAYGIPAADRPGDARAWADLCQVMFNAKEFIFVP